MKKIIIFFSSIILGFNSHKYFTSDTHTTTNTNLISEQSIIGLTTNDISKSFSVSAQQVISTKNDDNSAIVDTAQQNHTQLTFEEYFDLLRAIALRGATDKIAGEQVRAAESLDSLLHFKKHTTKPIDNNILKRLIEEYIDSYNNPNRMQIIPFNTSVAAINFDHDVQVTFTGVTNSLKLINKDGTITHTLYPVIVTKVPCNSLTALHS